MYLVIGGNGFLGSGIVSQLLARGERVRVLCRSKIDMPVEWSQGDIRNRDVVFAATRGCDVVFHTAALAGISVHWAPFYETNVLGTRNVIDACLANGVRKLVYTSSPSVTFDGKPQENVDESAPFPTRWLAHYPHSKAIAEKMVLETTGLLRCALRPHLIWGPGDRHLIPRLLDRARQGKLMRVGDGTNLIDMTHIENAAAAHWQAADALTENGPVNGRAYFLSDGNPVNCWARIDDFLKENGLSPVRKSISFRTAWRIGAVMEGLYKVCRLSGEPRMTRFLAAQLALPHYFDISRARTDFGYAPLSYEPGTVFPTSATGNAVPGS